ncbi:MAG: DUF6498-containing protein [Planctomycetota bacterium]|nr:DUF6498-containing protein [Planctomycetota bacterium]
MWLDAKPRSDRLTPKSPTAIVLVLVNLIPIVGVFAFDWKVGTILAIYWLENVAIGLLNVVKILMARGGDAGEHASKFFLAPFFCVHYGIFTVVHGAFVFSVFQEGGPFGDDFNFMQGPFAGAVDAVAHLWLPFLTLFASHLFSFIYNFVGRGEYRVKSPSDMMQAPYARVIVLHVTILFGGFVTMAMGSPKPVILLLVLAKTLGDTHFHLREHNRIADEADA